MKVRKNFWDKNAGRYDRFMRKDRAAYDEMYALIRPVVKAKTVLELATGTGLIAKHIQGRRMSQAEHLLIDTDFTMGQIAQMIGYSTSSRFAELFKKSTGILPIEYRKIARKQL